MKIIDRYVTKELLVTAMFAVTVLSLVLVLGNVFKRLLDLLVNHDVPLEYILSFIAYILPFSLTFTIPWGFLTAVLLVFGKMSAENELIALRSNGVSIPRICLPVGGLALVCTLICLWINISVAPRTQEKMHNALFKIATSNPIAMFGSDQVIEEFPLKKIYVEKKEGNALFNVLVYDLNEQGNPMRVIQARRGQLQADLANKQVIMHLDDLRYEARDANAPNDLNRIQQGVTAKEMPFPVSLQALYEKNKRRRGLPQMTLQELLRTKDTAFQSARLTEANKRFSFALASFAFALVGVPLAITAHRKETSIGFLFSVLVAFVYFFFIIVADTVRNNPKLHPEILIWVPNIIFITLGSVLFYRMSKR